MKAHVIENGIVVNTILVESLEDRPNLIDASQGGIGDSWDGETFTSPEPIPIDYRELRAKNYPPITEYLDGIVKGDQAQIDKYIADCLAVKEEYPKP